MRQSHCHCLMNLNRGPNRHPSNLHNRQMQDVFFQAGPFHL